MRSIITLSGHHFLCLLTYTGKGYSSDFERNMNAVVGHLNRGHTARIIKGFDSLCHDQRNSFMCPRMHGKTCNPYSKEEMDRLALADLRIHLPPADMWQEGNLVLFSASLVHQMRLAFAQGLIRRACVGCEWRGLCDEIAANSFKKTLLFPNISGAKLPPPTGLYIPFL